MAKKMRRLITLVMAVIFCMSMIATPAAAEVHGESSDATEWYQVIVNGKTVASASGEAGDHTWLVQGVYSWDVSVKGTTMTWRAGKHNGVVNLEKYITIPEGYEITEDGYTVEHKSVEGTNSQSANFDNAIITVNIKVLYNPSTGEEIEIPDPSVPSTPTPDPSVPSTPDPVETAVTVNHIYKTYDAYTKLTVEDGRTTATEAATEGDVYTAAAVPSYGGNTYVQQTEDAALTITVVADASANVINIEYLRTIDTTPIDYNPVVKITKIADQKSYKEGDTVTWTITVKNISAYTAYNLVVTDELTNDRWTIEALVPGAEQSFTATIENVSAGTLKNVAEVTWTDNDEIPDENEPEEPKEAKDDEISNIRELIDYAPVLSVVKTAEKMVYEAGETVTWTITVKNISEFTAYNVSIVDELTGDIWGIKTLTPGAEKSFTTSLENAKPGSVKNVVVVTWEDNDEIPDEEETDEIRTTSDEELVGINDPKPENYTPVLNVTKTAGKEVYGYGETIIWTITVKNVSEYPAYNVVIVDELTGDRWTVDTLAPGAEESFITSLSNAEPGTIRNVAVVTWEDGDEIPDEDETNEIKTTNDEEIVEKEEPVDYSPVLTLVKVADKETYEVGETITWTITVMNVGQHPAYDVTVVDELTGDEWFIDELAAGKQKLFTVSVENAAAGTVKNVVVASWTDNDEIPDEEEEEIKTSEDEEIVSVVEPPNPAPILRIVKTSSKYLFETGETVTWYISVENISDFTAYNVVVVDELTNDRWYVGTLEPGAARTFATTTETDEAGFITNVAVVTWTDGDETPDAEETEEIKRGSDDARVVVEDPAPDNDPAPQDDDIIIEDEDVPLAAAPKTGDISGVLAAISMISFGGMILLKKKED